MNLFYHNDTIVQTLYFYLNNALMVAFDFRRIALSKDVIL